MDKRLRHDIVDSDPEDFTAGEIDLTCYSDDPLALTTAPAQDDDTRSNLRDLGYDSPRSGDDNEYRAVQYFPEEHQAQSGQLYDAHAHNAAEPDPIPSAQPLEHYKQPPAKRARKAKPDGEGKFRLKCKNAFFTWPQCDTPMATILDRIKAHFAEKLKYVVVCEEDHHDTEGVHRHATLCFNKTLDVTGMPTLDALAGKHGSYGPCRDVLASIKYTKKDKTFVEYGDEPKTKNSGNPKITDILAKAAMEGKTLDELNTVSPGYVFQHYRSASDYIAWRGELDAQKLVPPKLPWHPISIETMATMPDCWIEVASWLNDNLFTVRKHRQTQLYIHGPTAVGKSLLVEWLNQFCNIFRMPHSKWMEGFDVKKADLAICDEFSGCYPIGFINEFTQGTPMRLEVKNGFIHKTKNIPIIFISNQPLTDIYNKTTKSELVTDALLARWKTVFIGVRSDFFVPPNTV